MNWLALKNRFGERRVLLIIALAVVGIAYCAYRIGFWHQGYTAQKLDDMGQSIERLNQHNHDLTRRLNILGVELEVEQLAAQKSQHVIQDVLEQNNALKRELVFYQKVMAPELESQGVTIESLHIENTLSNNYFRFALVLMQRSKRTGYVKGTTTMQLIGSEGGQPKRYNLLQLAQNEAKSQFQFKYFDVIEGEIELPEGFTPERVFVQANLLKNNKVDGQLQRTFDWQSLVQS